MASVYSGSNLLPDLREPDFLNYRWRPFFTWAVGPWRCVNLFNRALEMLLLAYLLR